MVADGFTNGTHREPHDEGDTGALSPTERRGQRSALVMLGKQVRKGQVAADKVAELMHFAEAIARDPQAGPRDQLRALEFLEIVSVHGAAAAVDGDKIERLDSGGASDRVEVVFTGRVPRSMTYAKD